MQEGAGHERESILFAEREGNAKREGGFPSGTGHPRLTITSYTLLLRRKIFHNRKKHIKKMKNKMPKTKESQIAASRGCCVVREGGDGKVAGRGGSVARTGIFGRGMDGGCFGGIIYQ